MISRGMKVVVPYPDNEPLWENCPDCRGYADLEVVAALHRWETVQALGGDPNEGPPE